MKNDIWDIINAKDVPKGGDTINSSWVMKKRANGDYRACLAAHQFKQTQGKSFAHNDISSLVVHDITAQIVLVLMLMTNMSAHLVDVNGLS